MKRPYLETFLISLAVLLLEVSYTRVFSFKLVYYFTYVVIGISLLGIGAGGVFVAATRRLRAAPIENVLAGCALAGSTSVLVGYLVAALVPLELFELVLQLREPGSASWGLLIGESLKLAIVLGALVTPFLAAGIALAVIFSGDTEDIARLYSVDLLGAALACVLVIPALTWLTPPGTILLGGVALAAAGLRCATALGPAVRPALGTVMALLLIGVIFPSAIPDPVRDSVKAGADPKPAIFSRWSPVFRVDVVPVDGSDPQIHFLVHDGTAGASIVEYDGNTDSLERYENSDRAYPYRLLGQDPKVAIIGSAGGNEILASLRLGSKDVTGIELNPVTVSLLKEHFLDFTGRLAEDPRVRIVNAEGRSYLNGSGETFDLIWLVAPDSYAAMNAASAGAFVLSESYLYTKEMIVEALRRLGDDGILCAQFGEIDFDDKPNRVVRFLGTAREAFAELDLGDDFSNHALVAVAPGFGRLASASILLSKTPFTAGQREAFQTAVAAVPGARHIYASDDRDPDGQISRVIELPPGELERFYSEHPYRVRPITDDAPFFWHFIGFPAAIFGQSGLELNVEDGIGERLLVVLLLVASIFAALLLLLPVATFWSVWREIPYKGNAGVYFACLGLGFMFIEVALIQKLTLFLGYPTYSLTVTLFALLVFTGLGSLASERYMAARDRAYPVLFGAIVGMVVLYHLVLTGIVEHGVGWPFPTRIAITVALLAPLGLALGAFMPLGLRSVSQATPHSQEFVAWCWAVNGFFSVVASVLSTILSMTLGFQVVMYIGLALYAVGIIAFRAVPAPRAGTA